MSLQTLKCTTCITFAELVRPVLGGKACGSTVEIIVCCQSDEMPIVQLQVLEAAAKRCA